MERPQPQLGTHNKTTGDRVLAWFVDGLILGAVTIAIAWSIGEWSTVIWIWGFGSFGYHTVFEATYGQTYGKKAANIVVVKEDGTACDWEASAIRNLVRVVDAFFFYLVGLVVILVSDDNQRLGDLVASTVVPEVASGDEPPESDFVIELHQDDDDGDRYVELLNESREEVDLSRATLRTESGSEFRFPQGEAVHSPGNSKTFLVSADFVIEPGSPVTLLTRTNERYEVRWDGT